MHRPLSLLDPKSEGIFGIRRNEPVDGNITAPVMFPSAMFQVQSITIQTVLFGHLSDFPLTADGITGCRVKTSVTHGFPGHREQISRVYYKTRTGVGADDEAGNFSPGTIDEC